jgi:hypothetical protein
MSFQISLNSFIVKYKYENRRFLIRAVYIIFGRLDGRKASRLGNQQSDPAVIPKRDFELGEKK